MERSRKGNYLDFHIYSFPKSFYFFKSLLSVPSVLRFFSTLLVFFGYFQQAALTFLPHVCEYNREGSTTYIREFLSILLFLHPKPYKFSDVDPILSIISLLILLILLIIVSMLLCDTYGLPIPKILMNTRGLMFLFVPSLYSTIISTHLGMYINKYGYAELSQTHAISINLTLVVDIIDIFFLSIWAIPIIKKSPILSKSHLPTTLIPNGRMTASYFIVLFFVAIECISTHRFMSIFYTFAMAYVGIIRLYFVIKQPFLSKVDSAITASISLSWIIIGIANVVYRKIGSLKEVAMLSLCIVFLVLAFFGFLTFFSYQEKTIISNLMTNSVRFVDTEYALKTVQIAVINNNITQHLINELAELNRVNGSLESITAEVYIRLLRGKKEDYKIISTIIKPLVYSKTASWSFRYTIFELACQYHRDYYSQDEIPPIQHVEWHINHYKNALDRFWTETLTRDITESRKIMLELRKYYANAIHEFRAVRFFFPKSPQVQEIFKEFFLPLEPAGSFNEPLIDLKDRKIEYLNNRSVKTDFFASKNKTDKVLIGLLIAHVTSILILIVLAYPGAVAADFRDPVEKMPHFIGATQRMIMTWLNISAGIIHLNNKNIFTKDSCERDVPKELRAHCSTISHIINEFENSSYALIDDLMTINDIYDEFIQYKEFEEAQSVWLVRNIIMYSAEKIGDTIISEIVQNIRAIFVNFAGMIIAKDYISSESSRILWPDTYVFYNITDQVLATLRSTYKYYFDFLVRVREEKLILKSPMIISCTAIFSIIYIVLLYSMATLKSYHFHKQISKFFATGQHPYHPDVEWPQFEQKPFHILPGIWNIFGIGFGFVLISLIINTVFNVYIQSEFIDAVNKIDVILNTADIGHILGFIGHHTHRKWLFKEEIDEVYFMALFNQLQDLVINLSSKLNPTYTNLKSIPEELTNPNITNTTGGNVTAHKLFDSYNIYQLICQISYGIYRTIQSNYSSNILFEVLHSQEHIFLEHISPKIISLVLFLKSEVKASTHEVHFFGFHSITINVLLFLIESIIFVLLSMYLKSIQLQFDRIIQALDPAFISSHSFLMEYFTKTGDDYTGIPSPIFKFYGKCGLNLILTDSLGTIICATSGTRNLFCHSSVQLIGQNLEVLISTRTQNSSGLWTLLRMMKKGSSEPFLEKDVMGITGDGADISIHMAIAMLKAKDGTPFFLIEFKSNNESNFLEEQFSEVYEYSSDLISNSLPVSLFSVIPEDTFMKQHFDSGILLIIGFQENNSQEFNEFKTQFIADIAQLRGGFGNGFMVKMTPSEAVIVFADVLKNNSHYSNALEVFRVFREEAFIPYGVAISVDPFDAVLFREPQNVGGKENNEYITSKDAANYVATMLIEPQIPELSLYGDLINNVKKGSVIVTKDIADITNARCLAKIKGLPLELYYIDMNCINCF